MHANHLLFSVEIIFNSCQSFVLHTLSSSFLNYKGGCGRQCDFINKFCLLSVVMYKSYAETLEKPRKIYLEDSTVYEKLIVLRNIHRL